MYYADIYSLSPCTHSSHTLSIFWAKIYVMPEIFSQLYVIHNISVWFWFLGCLMHTLAMPGCRKIYDQLVLPFRTSMQKMCMRWFLYNIGLISIWIRMLFYLHVENKRSSDVVFMMLFPILVRLWNNPLISIFMVGPMWNFETFVKGCKWLLGFLDDLYYTWEFRMHLFAIQSVFDS